MALKTITEERAEISDLIYEIQEISEQTYEFIEQALFDAKLYPENGITFLKFEENESQKTVLSSEMLKKNPSLEWLNIVLIRIINELDCNEVILWAES